MYSAQLPIPSPLGILTLCASEEGLFRVDFEERPPHPFSFSYAERAAVLESVSESVSERAERILTQAARELTEYFAGERREFSVPLHPVGTPFQQKVWAALCEIPYGETRTYGEIARQIGAPKAARAVGMANHRNPLPLFIPCHRVVGASGEFTGYAGGLDRKRFLLALERQPLRGVSCPFF